MSFKLSVHNYKCLHDAKVEFHPLTVLCGLNNVGKSSLIQALVLLHAALCRTSETVPLNGVYGIDLGQVSDVVTTSAEDEELILGVQDENQSLSCRFDASADREQDRYLTVIGCSDHNSLLLGSRARFGFTYLCAERNGPRDYQSVQSMPRELMEVGARGEYAADVANEFEYEMIRDEMVHPSQAESTDKNQRLMYNLQLWMRDLFPDLSILTSRVPDAAVATVRYRKQSVEAEWMRPANCGFGISYVLPIVLAGLLVPNDGIIVVENPEAHLHPAGQSFIGQFLARLAASGVYVVIETHSDHILNGIRLACVDKHPISRDDVRLYNFTTSDDGTPVIEDIRVTETGNLTQWPKQFFDQTEKDLSQILKARKKN